MKTGLKFIVRCEHRPRCGGGSVFLRCSPEAALKAAKDHAAGRKKHPTSVYAVLGSPDYTVTPEQVAQEGYKYVPTREYDYF